MLRSAQIDRFNRDGYLVVENVVDPALLARIEVEYAGVIAGLYADAVAEGHVDPVSLPDHWAELDALNRAGVEWFQPLDISLPHADITEQTPLHCGTAAFDLLTHAPVLDLAESLLGGELTSNPIQHVRIKPPQREVAGDEARAHITATAWHQDRGVGLAESDETEIVTVWIAMNDATVENGCLQVIPNPPADMYPHCPKAQTTIADKFVEADRAVHAPVGRGGVVLIHPLTPHCAGPNTSDGYRWSFDIRYNVTGQPTGRSQFPDFVVRSRSDPTTELRDAAMWKTMWEAARTRAATTPHIPQHRWQADSANCA